jgi:hypothetical protein
MTAVILSDCNPFFVNLYFLRGIGGARLRIPGPSALDLGDQCAEPFGFPVDPVQFLKQEANTIMVGQFGHRRTM